MSYISPIEIAERISNQIEDNIMEVIFSYGIKIDKNELIKALAYDRGQYEKGYTDGQMVGERRAKVKTTGQKNVYECCECGQYFHLTSWHRYVKYCSNCGAKLDWSDYARSD